MSSDSPVLLIFGYGSIMWKPEFEYSRRYPCCISGYKRVFYQGCTDHRGVPGKSGRVVTLIPSNSSESWVAGIAFELPTEPTLRAEILAKLDHRERGGYDRIEVKLHELHTHEPLKLPEGAVCLCYVANEDNCGYLGEAPEECIAAQILSCKGKSGSNLEYLLKLAEVLRELKADDEHVFAVETATRRLMEG